MYSEKISQLIERCQNSPVDLDDIVDNVNLIVKYVNTVITGSLKRQAMQFRLEGEDFRILCDELNTSRIQAHDKACEAIVVMNNIAARHGMIKIFDFELEQRTHNTHLQRYTADNHTKVAIFAGELINELYEQGQMIFKNQETVLDQVTDLGKQALIKNSEDLQERADACVEKNTLDLNKLFIEQNNSEIFIKLRDGSNELQIEPNIYKGNIYDVNVTTKEPVPEFDIYPQRDNTYFDVPAHLLKDIIDKHGGFELEESSIDKLIEFSEEQINENINKENLNKDEIKKDTLKPNSNTDFNL